MHKIKLFLILSFFLSAQLIAKENSPIHISDVWINEAPPTVSVLAAYATIQNLSDEEKVLTSVTSPTFSKVELHLSKVENEMATMEKQESLVIPANNTIKFTPGAYHLMLFNPEEALKAEDKISIEFNFADGTTYTIEAVVKKNNMSGYEHHHHNH